MPKEDLVGEGRVLEQDRRWRALEGWNSNFAADRSRNDRGNAGGHVVCEAIARGILRRETPRGDT